MRYHAQKIVAAPAAYVVPVEERRYRVASKCACAIMAIKTIDDGKAKQRLAIDASHARRQYEACDQ